MSFKSLFGNFEHQNDGGSRSVAERQRALQDVQAKRKRLTNNIERRRKLLAGLNAELLPLFQHYRRISRDKSKVGEQQRLLQKIAPLEKRIRKEETELRIDENLERSGEVTQGATNDGDVRSEYLAALRDATPYVRARTTMTGDEASNILSNFTEVQLETNAHNSMLSAALNENLELLDADTEVDANKSEVAADASVATDAGSVMARLAARFAGDEADILDAQAAEQSATTNTSQRSTSSNVDPTAYSSSIGAELYPQPPSAKPTKMRNQPVAVAVGAGKQHKFITFDDDV